MNPTPDDLATPTECLIDGKHSPRNPSVLRRNRRRRMTLAALPAVAIAATACQPRLGTFLPTTVNATYNYSVCDIVREAQALGATIQRVQQVADTPNGLNPLVATLHDAGIDTHLTFKANVGIPRTLLPDDPNIPGDENAAAGTTSTEYRRGLSQRLDEYRALTGSPAPLIAIENEANHGQFYDGTAADYLTELAIAVEVAHGQGVKVTDSGIATKAVKLLAWNHIRSTQGKTAADAYARTTFRSAADNNDLPIRDQLLAISATEPDPHSRLGNAVLRQNWQDADQMLAAYGNGGGQIPIDYVNFHWYVPDEPNTSGYSDKQSLLDTISALESITGLQAVTNEIGQHGSDLEAVTNTLDVVVREKPLPYVMWFDADGSPAKGLFNPLTPGDLRPTGQAFRSYVTPNAYPPSSCDN